MALIFIVIIIILSIELTDKNNKINKLERELFNLRRMVPYYNNQQNYQYNYNRQYQQQYNQKSTNNYNNQYNYEKIENKQIKAKTKMNEKEIKNSAILVTGAVLIILASIIFLTSTWGTIHSFIKLSVFILMLIVFAGASYIADNIFKIKQTAKVFFYISLSYFPMTLFSISWLGLLGVNLSLFGKYQYIYFTLCSIITALIYYFISKKKESIPIYVGSIIFQILSVIIFILNFTHNMISISLGLLIYSCIFEIIYLINNKQDKRKVNYVISNIMPSISIILLIFPMFLNFISNKLGIVDLLAIIFVIINSNIILTKINKERKIYDIVLPILIVLTSIIFANLKILNLGIMFKQIIIILSVIPVLSIDFFKDKELKISSYIITTITLAIIYFSTKVLDPTIPSWIILLIETTITMAISYINDHNEEEYIIASIISIMLTTFDIIEYFNLSYLIAIIISTIILSLKMFTKKHNEVLLISGIVSTIISAITIINIEEINYLTSILFFIPSIILIYYAVKDKNEITKIIGYVGLGSSLLMLSITIDFISSFKYIISLFTIIIIGLEILFKELYQQESKFYIFAGFIVSAIALTIEKNLLDLSIILLLIIVSLLYIKYYKLKDTTHILTWILLCFCIYTHTYKIGEISINYIISLISILGILALPIIKRNLKYYPVIGYGTILLHSINFDNIRYLPITLFLLASIIYTYLSNEKFKKIFMCALYAFITILYNMVINDLSLDKYALFTNGYYLILALLFTRTIIKNDKSENTDYKILEYFFLSIICLFTIGNYTSEFDGILFVSLLVIITIVSYIFKFGPAFLVSIIFIIINSILLTREFWLSVPWWIYILVIGSLLIAFAVRNELNENNKKNMKKKISNLKKHLDI